MSDTLQRAFEEASKLPPEEQDRVGHALLEELEDRRAWAEKFAATPHILEKLAEEARADDAAGRCRPLEELFG